jgi:hypothetical protein
MGMLTDFCQGLTQCKRLPAELGDTELRRTHALLNYRWPQSSEAAVHYRFTFDTSATL